MSFINQIIKNGVTYDIQDRNAISNPSQKTSGQVLTFDGTDWTAVTPATPSTTTQHSFTLSEASFTNNVATVPITGITVDTMGVLGIANTATAEQYELAGKSQLRCTGQQQGSITIIRSDASWNTGTVPMVLTIFE